MAEHYLWQRLIGYRKRFDGGLASVYEGMYEFQDGRQTLIYKESWPVYGLHGMAMMMESIPTPFCPHVDQYEIGPKLYSSPHDDRPTD